MYVYKIHTCSREKKDCVARRGVINDTLSGRIIFITTNSWLCTVAHILRVADKGRCYAARPWRINLLIKAIPLTPAGATTHLIRHRESNFGRLYFSLFSSFNYPHRLPRDLEISRQTSRIITYNIRSRGYARYVRSHYNTNSDIIIWIITIRKCFMMNKTLMIN